MSSLSDVLSNAAPAAVEQAPVPAETPAPTAEATPTSGDTAPPVDKAAETTPRDESGKFVAKQQEKQVSQPKQDLTERERAFLARATDETRKRQELEARIKQLETKPPEPEKPFWDDPEGAVKRLNDNNQEVIKATQTIATNTRLQVSEMIARKSHEDFDDKVNEFSEMLKDAPYLMNQMLQDPDPAEFVYKTAKTRIELREAGNVDAFREKIRKEERLKLEQEFKKKEEEAAKQRAAIPQSLSEVAGATGSQAAVWAGPTSLKNILA